MLTATERLRTGKVLIVGVGGLGAPAALQLSAVGVGTIGLVDGDAVDASNLPRQVAYRTVDLGRPKVMAAADRLRRLAPGVRVEVFGTRLDADNFAEISAGFDFIVDATDQPASKYLVNDGAVLRGVPFSHAGVLGFFGQTLTVLPHRSACLRCLFPIPPVDGDVPTCEAAGVVGPVVGTLGLLQAGEALKFLLASGNLLSDRLLTYDGLSGRWHAVEVRRARDCPLCGDRPTIRRIEPIEHACAGAAVDRAVRPT